MRLDFSDNKLILPDLISDNAILQADCPVRIWGYTDSCKEIYARIISREGICVSEGSGFANPHTSKFELELPRVGSGSMTYDLIIETDEYIKVIRNLIFGDVWIMAGQSNMVMRICEIDTPEIVENLLHGGNLHTESKGENNEIRFFSNTSRSEVSIDEENITGKWEIASLDSIMNFSAVGYEMLKNLREKRKKPVGGILIAVGGSSIVSWEKDAPLFKSKVLPLTHISIAGIVWYQGESDSYSLSPVYGKYYEALEGFIKDWRDVCFQKNIPFVIVQLPLSFYYADRPGGELFCDYESVRMAQDKVYNLLKDQRVYLVSTLDCGPNGREKISIHFDDKVKIGQRLAQVAMVVNESQDDGASYMGPYVSRVITTEDETVRIYWKGFGNGLTTADGMFLRGFFVSQNLEQYYKAKATIVGEDCVELELPEQIKSVNGIHYMMETTDCYEYYEEFSSKVRVFQKPNLVNSYGVPAISFDRILDC